MSKFVTFLLHFVAEFFIVLFVYTMVSFLQKKLSKKGKGKFSFKETINEAWPICLVITIAIVIVDSFI